MYNILKEAHNGIGMLLLFLLLINIIFILFKFNGVLLYFLSPLGLSNFSGESMGHKISRFYIVEHPIGMIVAAVLITIGYKTVKKTNLSEASKYKRLLIYYGLGFGITAYLIPWFLWS